jgi:hypothetical protein
MMEDEGSDVNKSGNPDSSDSQTEGSGDGQSYVMGDQRFKSAEDLYKSYKSLESKLGGLSDLEAKARAYDEAAEALAAERGMTQSEAATQLRDETRKLLEKHAPKIEESKRVDELRSLKLDIERRDLVDEHPEVKPMLPMLLEHAKVTGKSLKAVFEDFRPLADKLSETSKSMSTAPKTSFRSEGDEETSSSAREYQKRMEAYAQAKTPADRERFLNEALKAKLFKR